MEMLFMPLSEPMQHNQPIQAIHLYPYRKVLSKCVFYLWNRGYSLANCILGRAGVLPAVLLLDILCQLVCLTLIFLQTFIEYNILFISHNRINQSIKYIYVNKII